jgi:hypothetical protein
MTTQQPSQPPQQPPLPNDLPNYITITQRMRSGSIVYRYECVCGKLGHYRPLPIAVKRGAAAHVRAHVAAHTEHSTE